MVKAGWVRWLLYSVLIGAGLSLLWFLRTALVPFALALVLAYMLEPPVCWLTDRGLERAWAIVLIFTALGLAVAAVFFFLVPGLIAELQDLAEAVPRYTKALQNWLTHVQDDYDRIILPDALRKALDEGLGQLEVRLTSAGARMVEGLLGLALGVASLILVPLLAYYMIKDSTGWKEQLARWLPITSRPGWLNLLRKIDQVLAGFVRGQLLIAAGVGLAVALLVWALGLPFAVLLGLLAGIGEFVPYIGPILGSIPAVAVAGLHSPGAALKMIIGLLVVSQLEQAFLVPRVFYASTGLHPLLVIFVLLAGGQIAGLAGVILAVPVTAIGKEIILHLYRFRKV